MLQDDKVRRLATEFACQWLHVYDFDDPRREERAALPHVRRPPRRDVRGDDPLLHRPLPARPAGPRVPRRRLTRSSTDRSPSTTASPAWPATTGDGSRASRRSAGAASSGSPRTLAKQSGASRTSPILRGNWVSEVLLGEKLPKPPPGVPPLPDDEAATGGLTVRQLVERHSRDPNCATCHVRIDPIGFSLEAYDAIGRTSRDGPGRPPHRRSTRRCRTAPNSPASTACAITC